MARSTPTLASLPIPTPEYDQHYMYELVRALEIALDELKAKEFVKGGWTITTANLTTARAAGLASASDAGNLISTLVDDLVRKGVLDGV